MTTAARAARRMNIKVAEDNPFLSARATTRASVPSGSRRDARDALHFRRASGGWRLRSAPAKLLARGSCARSRSRLKHGVDGARRVGAPFEQLGAVPTSLRINPLPRA
jgi:hypothetical protein